MLVVEVKETFGDRIRAYRKSIIDPETMRPLSRGRMAERVGVCESTLRNWERGRAIPLGVHRRELVRIFPGIFSARGVELTATH